MSNEEISNKELLDSLSDDLVRGNKGEVLGASVAVGAMMLAAVTAPTVYDLSKKESFLDQDKYAASVCMESQVGRAMQDSNWAIGDDAVNVVLEADGKKLDECIARVRKRNNNQLWGLAPMTLTFLAASFGAGAFAWSQRRAAQEAKKYLDLFHNKAGDALDDVEKFQVPDSRKFTGNIVDMFTFDRNKNRDNDPAPL